MTRRPPRIAPATTPIRPGEGAYPEQTVFLDDGDGVIAADVCEKLNACARLVFALYMHPHANELFSSPYMTRSLLNAYMAAAKAWGL